MTKLERRITTAIATGSILLQMALPTFAATELVISGNGSDSTSGIAVEQGGSTQVQQTNNTVITNNIDVKADTGDNEAEDNTGGEVSVESGNASATVSVTNVANQNTANVESCDCEEDVTVTIEGNGTDSDNGVELGLGHSTSVVQNNQAVLYNNVEVDAKTGDNKAEDNTGGDVSVDSGDADATVSVSNMANMNSASIAPANGGEGSVELLISGNGSDSDNGIKLGLGGLTQLAQQNSTWITNKLDVDAETGDNEAEDNTGGEVSVESGDATVDVSVDNMAGFNWANIEDCCLEDIFAKIAGNGTDSENYISASLGGGLQVLQDNSCGLGESGLRFFFMGGCFNNDLEVDALTGDNDAEDNTGEPGSDPEVVSGSAIVDVEVDNMGGSNEYGSGAPDWEWPGESNVSIHFDISELMELLSDWLMSHA